MLSNIKEGERSYKIKTASGILKSNVTGTLAGFGAAVFLKDAPNLVSLDEAETRYKMDYKQYEYFKCLDQNDSVVKAFYKDKRSRMYIARGSARDNVVQDIINVFVDTVSNRITDYSTRQVAEAKRARETIRMLGFPGEGSLTYDIMSGGMINNPVTPNALKIAAEIFGRDVATMRGKMTVSKAVSNSMIEVETDADQTQEMHTDVFEYEGQPCLLTVVSPLGLVMINSILTEQTEMKMRTIIEGQVKAIRSRGFRISKILVDPAGQFMKMSKYPVLGVEVYPVGPNAHVRRAERAIRTLKDRARAVQSSLPWKLPKSLVQYLLSFVCIRMNQLARRSVGPRAPIERFMGRKIDFHRDVRAGFGDYVQIKTNPKHMNTSEQRTRGCIVLMPTNNLSGTHALYSLDKGTRINADNWVALPTPDIVIEKMNSIAKEEEKVKVKTNRKKLTVEPAAAEETAEETPLTDAQLRELGETYVELEAKASGTETEHRHELIGVPEQPPSLPDQVNETTGTHTGTPPEDSVVPGDDDEDKKSESSNTPEYVRRSARTTKERQVLNLHMYIDEAYRKFPNEAKASALKELKEMLAREVFTPLNPKDFSKTKLKGVLKSFMFFKEKYNLGAFDKLKARLVGNGSQQINVEAINKASPTAKLESILMAFGIAASEERYIISADIGNAYLEASMSGEEVHMELDKLQVKLLTEISPNLKPYVDDKGKMIVKLDKALYGCVQSAKLWYDHLTSTIKRFGFKANDYDPCVLNKIVNGKQITVVIYVDDLLITCKDEKTLNDFVKDLESVFKEVKLSNKDVLQYLGYEVKNNADKIEISMSKYLDDVITERGTTGHSNTPARLNLMDEDKNAELLGEKDRKKFHRNVAQLLYVAKRFRFDILLTISHLASKVQAPTEQDDKDLDRVYKYLNKTKDVKMVFNKGKAFSAFGMIDAAYGVHTNGVSRTGIMIFLFGVCVGAWTAKQKIVTKSSTEAELVALTDGSGHVIWLRNWLIGQGYPPDPITIYQDNRGVIDLMNGNLVPSQRTKHLNIRYFFAGNKIRDGEITLKHMSTEDMIADLLTKVLSGETFQRLADKIFGI